MSPTRPETRADLRSTDYHASWREVYAQLEVSTSHEPADQDGGGS